MLKRSGGLFLLKKLSELVTKYPKVMIGIWIGVFFVGAYGAINLQDVYDVTHYGEEGNSESDRAEAIIIEEFGEIQNQISFAFYIIFEDQVNITEGTAYSTLLNNISNGIMVEFQGKYFPIHYWSSESPQGMDKSLLLSSSHLATYMVVIPDFVGFEDKVMDDTNKMRRLVKQQVEAHPITTFNQYAVTGMPASNQDAMSAAHKSMEESDIIAIFTVTAVLVFVFGSVLGIGIPLAALVSVLVGALGILFFLGSTNTMVVNDMVPNMVSMLGIGICADYNLLFVSRFREELENGINSAQAARTAIQTAGRTVIFSGFTVMIGFGTLIVLGGEMTFSIAMAVILTVSLSIFSVLTLSPAILTILGHKLEWPLWLSSSVSGMKRWGTNEEGASFWARWSRMVQRRPWTFLLIGIIILTPLIAAASMIKLSLPGVEFLPEGTESRTGFELMDEHFAVGELSPIKVIIQNKTDQGIFSQKIINGLVQLADWVFQHEEVKEYYAPNGFKRGPIQTALNYTELQAIFNNVSSDTFQIIDVAKGTVDWNPVNGGNNDTALLSIILDVSSGSSKSWNFINDLRSTLNSLFSDVSHYVGGQSASFLDENNELWADFPLMVALCMILTFLVLMVLFRSILLPIKSIITILASVLLSYGVLVLVFQEGIGASLIGTEASGEGIIFFMPIFLFTAIFGLSMDYNVFILSRVKEEYDKSGDNTEAVALGIEKTGSVVTSAALIMVATFGVFVFSDLVFMQMIGLGLAVAVFVDATLIRTIILPSAMKLLGKWNWWLPSWLEKYIPKITVD